MVTDSSTSQPPAATLRMTMVKRRRPPVLYFLVRLWYTCPERKVRPVKTWIQKHTIIATLIPVLLVMVMIFCFSAQNGQDSGQVSGRITRFVLGMFVPDFDTWTAEMQAEVCSTVGLVVRKLGHFTEFFLLGFTLMLHIDAIGKKITLKLPWLIAWGVGTLYAVTDELHQGFVGGRHPAIMDVCIDSSGVVAGVLIIMLILRQIRRRTAQK